MKYWPIVVFLIFCSSPNVRDLPQEKKAQLLDSLAAKEELVEFKEGWISPHKVQALWQSNNPLSMEEEARERLAWLMLLEYYELQREDREIARQLAKSNFFINLGSETTKIIPKASKSTIWIAKEKNGLQNEWEAFLPNLEQKYPSLKNRRIKK